MLIAIDRGVERVACACEAGHAAGVRVGMTVAHARSLLAGRAVRVALHRPEEDARALDRMVQWALRFSPVVSADYPDGLLLDITGCAHLYAGEEKLAKKIVSALEQWRFAARVCVGPTAAVARAVARHTRERITVIPDHAAGDELRFLPVSALGVEPRTRDALAEVGVVDIDQLLNLPREDLAPRFGETLLTKIDQALGLAHELIEPARPIEPVELTRTFEGAIRNQEAIFLAVEQLLRELAGRLAREESGVSRLSLRFNRIEERHEGTEARRHEGNDANAETTTGNQPPLAGARGSDFFKPRSDISLSLSFPSRDFKHLWALLRPKVERVHLGYGVEEIVLRAHQMQRLPHTQMELWPDAALDTHVADHAVMGQWLDQVIERLGRHAVVEMQPAERYLPEQAFTSQTMEEVKNEARRHGGTEARRVQTKKAKTGVQAPGVYPAVRPSRLFSPPEHARVIALVPDGPPAWIQWQGQEMHVACGYGPERICAPWWNGWERHEGTKRGRPRREPPRHEEKAQNDTSPHSCSDVRDYFVIQTELGQWLWVYREGRTAEWFVHGEWT